MAVTLKDILPLLDKDGIIEITQANVTTIHAAPDDMVFETYEGTEVVKKIDIVDDPNLSIIHHIVLED